MPGEECFTLLMQVAQTGAYPPFYGGSGQDADPGGLTGESLFHKAGSWPLSGLLQFSDPSLWGTSSLQSCHFWAHVKQTPPLLPHWGHPPATGHLISSSCGLSLAKLCFSNFSLQNNPPSDLLKPRLLGPFPTVSESVGLGQASNSVFSTWKLPGGADAA